MADEPNPEHWQFPRLPDRDGHDLPTDTSEANKPAHHDQLQQVLVSPPLKNNDVLVQEITRGASRFCPLVADNLLPTKDARPSLNYSWIGTTLMALLNISPFLNLLNEVKASGQVVDPMVDVLHEIAQRFRPRVADEVTDEDHRAAINDDLRVLLRLISESRIGHPEPYHMLPHPADFAAYILRWIAEAQLQRAVDSTNIDLSTRFKQLFKFFTVPHAPLRCDCVPPRMRRQAASQSGLAGYVLGTEVQETKSVEQAIADHMWEEQTTTRTCPDCSKEVQTNDFLKYAYLPEVLLIYPAFTPRLGSVRVSPDVRFTYPERLDMSDLRDDPTRPGDQTDCVYKLESIVTWSIDITEYRYKAALRQDENLWYEFNDRPRPEGSMTGKTLDEIRGDDFHKPWLLIYVRERGAKAPANVQSAVRRLPIRPARPVLHEPPFLTSADAGVTSDPYDLERFVTAQYDGYENGTTFMEARDQLGDGRMTGRWIWYIFPVMSGLPASTRCPDGQKYTIESLAEARAYWSHRGLRERYMEILNVVWRCYEKHPFALFGEIHYMQNFLQSLTLFMLICNPPELNVFHEVMWKFFQGRCDQITAWQLLRWINAEGDSRALQEAFARINDSDPLEQVPPPRNGGDENTPSSTTGDQIQPTVTVTQPTPTTTQPAVIDSQPTVTTTQPAINTVEPAVNNTTQPRPSHNNTVHQPSPSSGAGHRQTGLNDDTDVFSGTGETNDAYEIGSVLLALADIKLSPDNPLETNDIGALNDQARRLGHTILDFAHSLDVPTPVPTHATNERARRLGRHLIRASLPADLSDAQPDDVHDASGAFEGDGTFDAKSDDGSGDDPSESSILDGDDDSQPNDEDPYGYVAIPTDPNDERILACEDWTLAEYRAAFHDEGLDWRGLRNDAGKYQAKFLKHFELERDYSIYHETKLRKVVREKISGVKCNANKAELVEVLTDYDEDILQHFEYVTDPDGSEETDSGESTGISEDYESSLASGTEAFFIGTRRDETPGDQGREKTAVQPQVVAAPAARARKRGRDDDYDDEGVTPRNGPKGPRRMRAL